MFSADGCAGRRSLFPIGLSLLLIMGGCGDRTDLDPAAAAEARSRAVAGARWHYGVDTVPGEPGRPEPQVVDRCAVTLPGASADTLDVACGLLFLALEPEADSAWIARLPEALGLEVADRGTLPAWSTELGEPLRYLLVRVETGRERRTSDRALRFDGVRFIDVREIKRRQP